MQEDCLTPFALIVEDHPLVADSLVACVRECDAELEATTQFDTRLFERNDAGAWRQVKSLADAAAGRIGGGTTHPVWALHLAPRQTTDLLLRIEGPSVVRFPLFVYHPVSFAERELKIHVAIGIALGSCLFIGV